MCAGGFMLFVCLFFVVVIQPDHFINVRCADLWLYCVKIE